MTAARDLSRIVAGETGTVKHIMSGALCVSHLDPSLPAVAGDASKLAEVVHTLLAFALRYSPYGGEIVVTTGVHAGQVVMSVQDQGLGVRADFDNRIFGDGDAYTN